jgi:2-polyprenyl-6-methoxyphenol hydroxylase-like FAD-dependent oxidoreductase
VFALSRASERVLRECGAWQRMRADRVFGYERMCVWDASGAPQGRGCVSFDCAEIGEPNLGSIVDARVLQAQCLQAARDAGVVLIEAALRKSVAATDGLRASRSATAANCAAAAWSAPTASESRTRELLGIGTAGHAYHQDALVAHVRTESRTRLGLAAIPADRPARVPAAARRPLVDRLEHGAQRGGALARPRCPRIRRRADRGERRGFGAASS